MDINNRLPCDISLGGSTSQWLDWSLRNLGREEFAQQVSNALLHRARTRPAKYGRRCASLIGLVYDQFNGNPRLLDIIIEGIHKAEAELSPKVED